MKFYVITLTLLWSSVSYGQVDTRVEIQTEQERGNQMRMQVRAEENAREKKPQDRVRALTDFGSSGSNLLRDQFNRAQQMRLENAGAIQSHKDTHRNDVRALIEEKRREWNEKKVMLENEKLRGISQMTAGIISKLDAGIMRLQKADSRIQMFINENTSQDITDAFSEAHILLEKAELSVDVIKTELGAELNSRDGVSFDAIRDLVTTALSDLREAWNAYIGITSSLTEEVESVTENENITNAAN